MMKFPNPFYTASKLPYLLIGVERFGSLCSLKIQYGRSRHLGAISAPLPAPTNFLNCPMTSATAKPFRQDCAKFCILFISQDIYGLLTFYQLFRRLSGSVGYKRRLTTNRMMNLLNFFFYKTRKLPYLLIGVKIFEVCAV